MYSKRRNIDEQDYVPDVMVRQIINTNLSDRTQSTSLLRNMDDLQSFKNINELARDTNVNMVEGFNSKIATSSTTVPVPTTVPVLDSKAQKIKDTIDYSRRVITNVGGGTISWNADNSTIAWSKDIQSVVNKKRGLKKIKANKGIVLPSDSALLHQAGKQQLSSLNYPNMIKLFKGDYVNNTDNGPEEIIGKNSPWGIYDANYFNPDTKEMVEVRGMSDRNLKLNGKVKFANDNIPFVVGKRSAVTMNKFKPNKKYTVAVVHRTKTFDNVVKKNPKIRIPLNVAMNLKVDGSTLESFSNGNTSLADLDTTIVSLKTNLEELKASKNEIKAKYNKLEKEIETHVNIKNRAMIVIENVKSEYEKFLTKKESLMSKINEYDKNKEKINGEIVVLKTKYMEVIKKFEDGQKNIEDAVQKIKTNQETLDGLTTAKKNIEEKINEVKMNIESAREVRSSMEDANSDVDSEDIVSPDVSDDEDVLESSDSEEDDSDGEDVEMEDDSEEDDSDEDEDSDSDAGVEGFGVLLSPSFGKKLAKLVKKYPKFTAKQIEDKVKSIGIMDAKKWLKAHSKEGFAISANIPGSESLARWKRKFPGLTNEQIKNNYRSIGSTFPVHEKFASFGHAEILKKVVKKQAKKLKKKYTNFSKDQIEELIKEMGSDKAEQWLKENSAEGFNIFNPGFMTNTFARGKDKASKFMTNTFLRDKEPFALKPQNLVDKLASKHPNVPKPVIAQKLKELGPNHIKNWLEEKREGFAPSSSMPEEENDNGWEVSIRTSSDPVTDVDVDNMALSFMIIWNRELSPKEQEYVVQALNKYKDTGKNIVDSINIPNDINGKLIVVNVNDIAQHYNRDTVLLAVNLKNRVKYLPENITFNTKQSNSYNVVNGTWEKRIVKPTIVMSKSSGKKWLASINDKGEIILEKIEE